MTHRVAVVGGGISGLAAAWRLREAGADVVVLEAAERAGGKIRSERIDGYLVEHGPNGFLDSREPAMRLARDLGLGDRLRPAGPATKRRYLCVDGRLRAVPTGPVAFLRSDVLSRRGRLRLLAEPFIPRRDGGADESVFDFAARRLGPEAAEKLIDALVTGVWAGDSRQTSMSAAFPRLVRLEQQHGSLVRGALAGLRGRRRRAGGPAGPYGRLSSFPDGMSELTGALTARLGDALRTGCAAAGLRRADGGRWTVETTDGAGPVEADAVVLAVPTPVAARLLAPLAPAAAPPLEAIPYAPAGVVALGFPADGLPRALDGFGFLVPARERRRVLGVVWCSVVFEGRAPADRVLVRAIVGGARQPEVLDRPDDELVTLVTEELAAIMGPLPAPVFRRVVRWPTAIPQYTLGHPDRVAAVRRAVAALPGLHLAGNGLFGVSVPDCVARADELPAEVLHR